MYIINFVTVLNQGMLAKPIIRRLLFLITIFISVTCQPISISLHPFQPSSPEEWLDLALHEVYTPVILYYEITQNV